MVSTAAHRGLVGFGRALERKSLAHRPPADELAEIERVLGIDGDAGRPTPHRASSQDERNPGTCSGSDAAPRMINLPLSMLQLASPLAC